MSLRQILRAYTYSGYDRKGRLKMLVGREASPGLTSVDGLPDALRDEALDMLCDAFGIPTNQRYCLRLDDKIGAIYNAITGPRWWDCMEFEELAMSLDKLPGPELTPASFRAIETVEDLIRRVAERRANQTANPS